MCVCMFACVCVCVCVCVQVTNRICSTEELVYEDEAAEGLQCVALCCSVLQCVAVCFSVM